MDWKRPLIDNLFFLVLVLNATGLFRFVASQLGVSIGQVSLALLVFNFFYLVCRLPYLVPMFAKILPWFVVLVAWALATLVYAPSIEMREIGLAIYGFALFAGTIVYTASNGLSAIRRVFLIGLILTVFGQVLNLVMPAYFEAVAALAEARVLSMGRPGGFFMQPNDLGIGLAFLFIGWLALAKRDTVFREPIIISVFLACELWTGSRTGMVLGVFIVGLHLAYQSCGKIFHFQETRFLLTRLAILVVCVLLGMIGTKFLLGIYGDQLGRQPSGLLDRAQRLMAFDLSDGKELMQDTSVRGRFAAQDIYWKRIKEKPLLGHGFGAEAFYFRNGDIELSSHSTLISVVLEYGVVYPVAFLLLLAGILLNRHRGQVARAFGTNTVMQFVLVTLLLFVGMGRLFDRRDFFVLLGMVYTTIYYPRSVFFWNKATRTYERILTTGEIRQARRNRKRGSRPGASGGSKTEAVDVKSGKVPAA